jgi:cytochrome c556
MNMDDQFLHQLRCDPPAGFAHQLKRQLDRFAATRTAAPRLLAAMAIFGTAFVLVTPSSRHIRADYSVSGLPPRWSALEAGAANGVAAMPYAPAIVAPVPPTPRMQAATVVTTRKGLFSVLAWVLRPLLPMLQGDGQFDAKAAGAGGERIRNLATMIPEVFSLDTHSFDLDTRAKDNIWTQADDFDLKARQLIDAANALTRAATARDRQAAATAADAIEAACDACHDVYVHNETELTKGATER